MKITILTVICLVVMMSFAGTAFADWPQGASGDQYNFCNDVLIRVATNVGISPETFIGIYDGAVAGDVSGYTDAQLAAACETVNELSVYTCEGTDYTIVYNRLSCSTRAVAAGSRGDLPGTGIAIGLLIGSGIVMIGGASHLVKRSR